MDKMENLFVWRGELDSRESSLITWTNKGICQFCQDLITPNKRSFGAEGHNWGDFKDEAICTEYQCPNCGWMQGEWKSWHQGTSIRSDKWKTQRTLQEFSLSSNEIALEELGTYLRVNFDKIYSLNPFRFEELVGAIFREHGWTVELTKKVADGGKDLIMLHNNTGEKAIVECKRYSNKISVDKVDRLIGVQLIDDVQKAFFVTTSSYTKPAAKRASSLGLRKYGFEIDLKDGDDILHMLGCFNEMMPTKLQNINTLRHRIGVNKT
ncbi:MAG: hypothetical protein ACJAXS_000941 [Colwellia sp.]|jgi:hypothetical protein